MVHPGNSCKAFEGANLETTEVLSMVGEVLQTLFFLFWLASHEKQVFSSLKKGTGLSHLRF